MQASAKWDFVGGFWCLCMLLAAPTAVLAIIEYAQHSHPRASPICTGDIHAMNKPSNLRDRLQGCRVVEGNLTVVLMEGADAELFETLSFPALREVTGFVLFYRVNRLTSLGKLFPSLTLIRGEQLFNNMYALVVCELPQLQELGLASLQLVQRGAVRVQRNPELCLAEELDWDVLAPSPPPGAEHNITDNKWAVECARCGCRLCWGPRVCREPQPFTVMRRPAAKPCHKFCAVGCNGPSSVDCTFCRGPEVRGDCVDRCGPGTVLFRGRRCVLPQYCQAQRVEQPDDAPARPGFVSRGRCVHFCPAGHLQVPAKSALGSRRPNVTLAAEWTCQPCMGPCPNTCDKGIIIRSIRDALKLKGCDVVNGTLEIEIQKGENVEEMLESALGGIKVIRGSLVVSRSRALSSLRFLRSLRAVLGLDQNKKQAVFINDNANLQTLFGQRRGSPSPPLTLSPGSLVTFFYNPRLCPEEIEELVAAANVSRDNLVDNFNGFINPCGSKNLSSAVAVLGPEAAVLTWRAWEPADELVGYAVFLAPAVRRNVTEYAAGADLCQLDGGADRDWVTVDVRFSRDESQVSQMVPRLRPAQLYAYYIKTYTTRVNLNSPIRYFRTRADRPSPPALVRAAAVHAAAAGNLLVTWEPPSRPNGPLSHYIVTGELRDDDDRRQLAGRDFCSFPATGSSSSGGYEALTPDTARRWMQRASDSATPSTPVGGCCCGAPLDENECERLLRGDGDVVDACGRRVVSLDRCAHALHTVVEEHVRHTGTLVFPKDDGTGAQARQRINLSEEWEWTSGPGPRKRRFVRIEGAGATSSLVAMLVPFGLYTVSVHACGQGDSDDDNGEGLQSRGTSPLVALCSAGALAANRTLPAADADVVAAANATLQSDAGGAASLLMSWTEPAHPNGPVVAYHVRYRYSDRQRGLQKEHCVPGQIYRQNAGRVRIQLNADVDADGRFVVQVRAVTLAGPGPWVYANVRAATGPSDTAGAGDPKGAEDPKGLEDTKVLEGTKSPQGTQSPKTLAGLVVAALLLTLALLSAGLLVLRRRDARGAAHDDDLGRRLVSADLTDCWDLPEHVLAEDWTPRPNASVRFWINPDRVTILGRVSRGDLASSPGQQAVHADDSAVEVELDYLRWHPTNPFHPINMESKCEDQPGSKADNEILDADAVQDLPSRTIFLHRQFEEASSSVNETSQGEYLDNSENRYNQRPQDIYWENSSPPLNMASQEPMLNSEIVGASAKKNVELDRHKVKEKTPDDVESWSSTDSFISVNLTTTE